MNPTANTQKQSHTHNTYKYKYRDKPNRKTHTTIHTKTHRHTHNQTKHLQPLKQITNYTIKTKDTKYKQNTVTKTSTHTNKQQQ